MRVLGCFLACGVVFCVAPSCSPSPGNPDGGTDAPTDVSVDITPPPPGSFCDLPGSRVYGTGGSMVIPPPSGVTEPDLSFIQLPAGYCVHYYATVAAARVIRFAPGGELFVASPSTATAGGAPVGAGEIVVVPDDNRDGYGDGNLTFQGSIASTHGLLFANGNFYFQNGTSILSVPYTSGQRTMSGTPTTVINITMYVSAGHWPKTIDQADDGTIYVTNGGDQGEICTGMPHPVHGAIFAVDGTTDGRVVADGFRNPIYLRCQHGHDNCFANELTLDGSGGESGREKMILVAQNQDWGYPCCATQNVPFPGISPTPDCSTVQADTDSFLVGNTPFGLDFETGVWPAPYTNNAFIAFHGTAGAWLGERIVSIQMDPTTGRALPGGDIDGGGGDSGSMSDFITGYQDNTQAHGRPADVTFAKDGRMFVSNDYNGVIYWVAPVGLMHP